MKRNILVALAFSIATPALAQTPTSPPTSSPPKLKLSGETGAVLYSGRVVHAYGERTDTINGQAALQSGIDLTAFAGAPIVAPVSGTVVFAGTKPTYGQTVDLDAGDGIVIRFAHFLKISVTQGTQVRVGEKIGVMGWRDKDAPPVLHLEVYWQGRSIDPASIENLTLIGGR